MVLLLFFGPPIVAAVILVLLFHLPFTYFEDGSRGMKFFFGVRVALMVLGFAGLFVFKSLGGYDKLTSSEFSPIGTDEQGLVILWISATVILFGIFSFLELLSVLGNRVLHDPARKRSEQADDDGKPDPVSN